MESCWDQKCQFHLKQNCLLEYSPEIKLVFLIYTYVLSTLVSGFNENCINLHNLILALRMRSHESLHCRGVKMEM